MTTFKPTTEQVRVLDAYRSGGSLQIEAGAGTGKTSTLRLLAQHNPADRLLYLCYNAITAKEARGSMPGTVDSVTAHAFAMRRLRGSKAPEVQAVLARLQAPRTANSKIGRQFGINSALDVGPDRNPLQPSTIIALARDTVTNWCYSEDPTITVRHVPRILGVDDDTHREIAPTLVKWAQRLWAEYTSPNGQLRTDHDHYLKLFALRGDIWDGYTAVLLDEAQDTNGVVAGMLTHQQRNGARLVVVGDRAQSLYQWRGAQDCMDRFPVDHTVQLTQSFRFGPNVAHEANKWLTALDARLRLTGTPTLPTTIGPVGVPDAVLCRTNATCIEQVLEAHIAGVKVALVGGGNDVRRLAEAAEQLQTEGSTWHPDLQAFTSWGAVQDFVENDGGGDLKTLVKLVDTYGTQQIIAAIDGCVDETQAQLTVSTAHRAKGREWGQVKVAGDFAEPEDGDPLDPAAGMLAYVTVTRARGRLDRGSLDWIDRYLATWNLTVTGDKETPPVVDETVIVAPMTAEPTPPGGDPAEAAPAATLDTWPEPDPRAEPDGLFAAATGGITARPVKLALPDDVWAMVDAWAATARKPPATVIADALTQLHAAAKVQQAITGRPFYETPPG